MKDYVYRVARKEECGSFRYCTQRAVKGMYAVNQLIIFALAIILMLSAYLAEAFMGAWYILKESCHCGYAYS